MTRIKICGITNLEDARAAVEAGANMLGFNFYRPSPRFIEPEKARAIIDELRSQPQNAEGVMTVGVFVNESSPEAVLEIMGRATVDAVQLHGDEGPEFCAPLKDDKDRFVIKVFRLSSDRTADKAAEFPADAIMIDAYDRELYGGTGRTVDWSLALRIRERVPRLFLAGGLSSENVAEAIRKVQPFAVDACSSLESSPGLKDPARLRAFVRAVRSS